MAIDGDRAIVGAVDESNLRVGQGAAYTFTRVSGPRWLQRARVSASDGEAGDRFGSSVAISGNTAVIGSPEDGTDGITSHGSAYVFVLDGNTWTPQAKLTATDKAQSDEFGLAVAIDGETVVVGAPGKNNERGAAYVFLRNGSNWSQQARLTARDGRSHDGFGRSVAITTNTIVVGAPMEHRTWTAQGAAYVFRKPTVWTQAAKITATGSRPYDWFGASVAIGGNTIVVGAHGGYFYHHGHEGAAYIFETQGTAWTQRQRLRAPFGGHDAFGASIAVANKTLVIGSPQDETIGGLNRGSAAVLLRLGYPWVSSAKLKATIIGEPSRDFGFSVALAGDTIIVGSVGDEVGLQDALGAAYVFNRRGTGWQQFARLTPIGGQAGDRFGWSVAGGGGSIASGSPFADVGTNVDQGAVYFFFYSTGTIWTP